MKVMKINERFKSNICLSYYFSCLTVCAVSETTPGWSVGKREPFTNHDSPHIAYQPDIKGRDSRKSDNGNKQREVVQSYQTINQRDSAVKWLL